MRREARLSENVGSVGVAKPGIKMKTIGTFLENRLIVAVGDITLFEGGAIVNAANSALLGEAAWMGRFIEREVPRYSPSAAPFRSGPRGRLPAGEAVSTGAGRFKASRLIHTVGPVWSGGGRGEPALLASCYHKSLALAAELGLDSIAFPAISTGVYGYPKDAAARVAYPAIAEFLSSNGTPREVWLVFYSEADAAIFIASIVP